MKEVSKPPGVTEFLLLPGREGRDEGERKSQLFHPHCFLGVTTNFPSFTSIAFNFLNPDTVFAS